MILKRLFVTAAILLVAQAACPGGTAVAPTTITLGVVSPLALTVNSANKGCLKLCADKTYTFSNGAGGHPIYIGTTDGGGGGATGSPADEVSAAVATVTPPGTHASTDFTVTPNQAGTDIYYLCDASGHGGIGGTIEVLAADDAACAAVPEGPTSTEDDESGGTPTTSTGSDDSNSFPVVPVAIGAVAVVGLGGAAVMMNQGGNSAGAGKNAGMLATAPSSRSASTSRSRGTSSASKGSRSKSSGGRMRAASGSSKARKTRARSGSGGIKKGKK